VAAVCEVVNIIFLNFMSHKLNN